MLSDSQCVIHDHIIHSLADFRRSFNRQGCVCAIGIHTMKKSALKLHKPDMAVT